MIGRIILGSIIVVVGYIFVWKPHIPLKLNGYVSWAEKYIGNTRTFYQLLGMVLCLVGFLIITNLHGAFINGMLGFIYK